MATKASGSSVKFNIGKESVFGTPPVAMQQLKSVTVGESLNSSASELQSTAITPIRDIAGLRNGLYTTSGSLGIEVATQGTEIFLEALLGNVVSEETSVGSGVFVKTYTRSSVLPSYTIERVYTNTSPLMTQKYVGVKVNQMAFTFEPGSLVTASVDVIGTKSDKGTVVIDASPEVYDHIPFAGIDAKSITIAGVTTKVLKANLTITNGLEATNVLGDQYADDIVEGVGEVSGDMDLYFSDRTHYDMFVAETEFPITIQLTRGTEIIKITIPKAKFSGNRDIPVATDKALVASYTFKGIQDESINGAVKIEVTNENA